jgi:hypothetical protein
MPRSLRLTGVGLVVALVCPIALWGQYPSELVGFNGPPIDDPVTSQEMFRQPQLSGSTDQYIVLNDPNVPYGNNAAFRASGLQTEGEAALEAYFRWVDPANPNAWLRLTTYEGPDRPNPALHTQGKVRFKIVNRSEFTRGQIGICLGIRETGENVPQLADGGTSGAIEWVGVTGVITDPNDPNVVIAPIPAITLPPSVSAVSLECIVSVDGAPHGGGFASFAGGNGVLDPPNNRGTLEHIAFTNVADDTAVLIDVAIDELQFEAPEPDPVLPPTIVTPILEGDTEITVTDLLFTVDQVELYLDGDLLQSQDVSTPDDVVFTVDPAAVGNVYTARQHDSVTGFWSDFSEPAEVRPVPILEWIQTSPLPMGLTGHQLVELNGYIYCIGGRSNDSPSAVDTVYYAPVNGDGSIGAWAATINLPQELACHGAAAYEGRVYAWGGWTFNYPTVNTCYYADQNADGSLGAWVTSAVTIPDNVDVSPPGIQMDAMGRGDMIYNGVLYIINGEWDNGETFNNTNNCYYSTITPEGDFSPWILTTPTETVDGSWFHGVAVIEGTTETYMYRVAGNYRGTTEWDMYRNTVQPDGSLGEWVEEPLHLPSGRYEHACASADNKWIFAICGLYGADPQNTVYYTEVDPDTGAFLGWFEGPTYPETVSRNAAVTYSVNGTTYLLVAGGGPYSAGQGNRTPNCYYAEIQETEELCPGDVDGDGDTDLSDLAALLAAYGSAPGDPNWNPACDFDSDSDVDLGDLAFLLADYGCGA